ncbi:MAG: heme NO-binding domain-containing protein [Pseudomonadota bacterium]
MIGIIEKVLVDCLIEVGGDELRQDVFFAAGIPADRVYRMDQHYPDAETARLLEATLTQTQLDAQAIFDLFTAQFFDIVEQVFPEFLRMCSSSEDLLRKQIKIHSIMAGGCRAAEDRQQVYDKFHLVDIGPHEIQVHYKSELQLSLLYETLMRYAAEKFGDTVVMQKIYPDPDAPDGAGGVVFHMRWTAIAGVPTELADDSSKAVAHG